MLLTTAASSVVCTMQAAQSCFTNTNNVKLDFLSMTLESPIINSYTADLKLEESQTRLQFSWKGR